METNKERNLRNVTQIGTPREDNKIYIENLVYTRLKDDIYSAKSVFVLMGHTECMENRYITFVEAVIPVNSIDFMGNMPKWNDYVWKDVFREIKRLYEDMIIVGWALDIKGMVPKVTPELERIHKEHFGGIHQLLFLMDTLEGEETIYVQKGTTLTAKDGFYIYYCTRAKSEYDEPYEPVSDIETIPITRKKPNREQRKSVDRLIGFDETTMQKRQEVTNESHIVQMHDYEGRSRRNRVGGDSYVNENRSHMHDNISDYTSLYTNQENNNGFYSNTNHSSQTGDIPRYHSRTYQEEWNNNRRYNHENENYDRYNRKMHENSLHKKNERKEAPSVGLDVDFTEWTSSRGGKYRQMLKENEQKKNGSSGTNASIAIAVAILAFVIGVGIYENGDAILERADKAAEVMSGNAQMETQQIQETQMQTETQTSTKTGTIPVEIISGENP